jgi:hypothetical protein
VAEKISIRPITCCPYSLQRRGTIRHLDKAINIARSTLHRWFKEGMLRCHSNSLKPLLKAKNINDRLLWCLAMIDPSSLPDDPKFYEMLNVIHVDEKWYNVSKRNRKFYLLPDEEDPHRTVQKKNAIDKVMFFSGVALPRWNDEGVCTFDGKLGMWAFVKKIWYTHRVRLMEARSTQQTNQPRAHLHLPHSQPTNHVPTSHLHLPPTLRKHACKSFLLLFSFTAIILHTRFQFENDFHHNIHDIFMHNLRSIVNIFLIF